MNAKKVVSDTQNNRSLYIPGDDNVVDDSDIRLNACKPKPGETNSTEFRNYDLMVHESGHALGLSNFTRNLLALQTASHPTIPNAVMNYDSETEVYEPDCSPHPFDIMAIYALYQTLVP